MHSSKSIKTRHRFNADKITEMVGRLDRLYNVLSYDR
jgi:hypothetical protein